MATDSISALLKYIAGSLVEDADSVIVEQNPQDDGTVILLLKLSKADIGRVIGRSGRTIDALRALVHYASVQENKSYLLQIFDE